MWFINYYECSECGEVWRNEDDCICNDKCPNCGNEIEPFKSKEIILD